MQSCGEGPSPGSLHAGWSASSKSSQSSLAGSNIWLELTQLFLSEVHLEQREHLIFSAGRGVDGDEQFPAALSLVGLWRNCLLMT